MNELRLTHHIRVLRSRMVKAMHTDLDRAISMQRIHLQRPRNQLPCHLSADVLFDGVQKWLLPNRQPRLVVVKLKIIRNERSQLLDIACVVSIEQLLIERRNRPRQLLLALHTVKRWNCLTIGRNKRARHQNKRHQSKELLHGHPPLLNWHTLRSTHSPGRMFAQSATTTLYRFIP